MKTHSNVDVLTTSATRPLESVHVHVSPAPSTAINMQAASDAPRDVTQYMASTAPQPRHNT